MSNPTLTVCLSAQLFKGSLASFTLQRSSRNHNKATA